MGKGSSRIGIFNAGLMPDHGRCSSRAQRVEHRLIQKTQKELHRLIDQQLNAEESSTDRALPPISDLPPTKASGWGRNRSVGSRIRKLLAQKIAGVDSRTADVSAAPLQAIRLTKQSDGNAVAKKYEVTMRTSITDPEGKVKVVEEKVAERTRAEIELHLLCESTFQLAAGVSHVDEANDILSLAELVRPLGEIKQTVVPDILLAPLEQAVSTAHSTNSSHVATEPALQSLSVEDENSSVVTQQPAPAAAVSDEVSRTLAESRVTITPLACSPPTPLSTAPPGSPASTSAALNSAASNSATSAPAPQSYCGAGQSSAAITNTYSATHFNTDIDQLQRQIITSHIPLHISADDYNCAWRCAWAMILTQQQPDALEARLVDVLGGDFGAQAAEVKRICSAVRSQGLNVILSKGERNRRLVFDDNGATMEALFNRLTIEILQKTGTSEVDAKTYFLPLKMAPAEAIGDLVSALGASCAVMQYARNDDSHSRSLSLRPKNDEVIEELEKPQGSDIDTMNFAAFCAPLPVAIISDNHFDLLIPPALLS